MARTTLVKNAQLVATIDDAFTLIPGGDVHLDGNRIAAVGKNLNVQADRTVDASGCLVTPGFVNSHHHSVQTMTRAVPAVQDEGLFNWLTYLYTVWQYIDPDVVAAASRVMAGELLLTGCTTTTDHFYLFPRSQPGELLDITIEGAREAGIRFHPTRGSMSLGQSHGGLPPDNVTQTDDEIMADCERLVAKYHDPKPFAMTRIALAPCSPFSVTKQLMLDSVRYARKHGLRCHTHLAETLDEENYCLEHFGKRPLALMEELEWLGNDIWYAHAIHLNEDELRKMAATGTGIGHCPTSNLRLGSGISPVRRMLDLGVPVGLGVDGSASNDSSDMLGELRNCLLVHRINTGVKSMPVSDVFRIACRGGARVLGRCDEIGSLEPGKAADLVLWDLGALGYAGAHHDPLAALLLAGDSHVAKTVLVNGEVVVDDFHLVNIDERKLAARANELALGLTRKRG